MALWLVCLTQNQKMHVGCEFESPSKAHLISLSLYTHCLVLVDSRNGFEQDFSNKFK